MADVELLPLPEHFAHQSERVQEHVRSYARANMEPLLRERDSLRNRLEDTVRELTDAKAENERLRAEVRGLRRQQSSWERHVAAAGCEYVLDEEHAALVNRRADRLAEALRRYGQHDDTCGVLVFGQIRCTCGFSAAIAAQQQGGAE